MRNRQSFTLIEIVVAVTIIILIASISFSPGLMRRNQQATLDRTVEQIVNAVSETRSLATSPTLVTNAGKVMQAWILVLNISHNNQTYSYGGTSYTVLADGYSMYAAEDIDPKLPRTEIKKVKLPSGVSVFYALPCHQTLDLNCTGGGESYFWKPHFRHLDGAIGFNGRFFSNPDYISDVKTAYWIPEMWGGDIDYASYPRYSELVIVADRLANPEATYDVSNCINGRYNNKLCKKIQVDNITGEINVL